MMVFSPILPIDCLKSYRTLDSLHSSNSFGCTKIWWYYCCVSKLQFKIQRFQLFQKIFILQKLTFKKNLRKYLKQKVNNSNQKQAYLSIMTGSLGVSFRLPQLFFSQQREHIISWVNRTRHIWNRYLFLLLPLTTEQHYKRIAILLLLFYPN